MSQDLYGLFQKCVVKLNASSENWGTGYFVAPGLLLTCAHIVRDAGGQLIQVIWQEQGFEAVVSEVTSKDIDLALLKLQGTVFEHPCALLDTAIEPGDSLYTFGYPDDFPEGATITLQSEGLAFDNTRLIKLKSGQVRPGMSGAPLLNMRTSKVCGVVSDTRGRSTDLGGLAISTTTIFEQFPDLLEVNQEFHQQDRQWKRLISPYRRTRRPQQENKQENATEAEQVSLGKIISPRLENQAVEKVATADRPVSSLREDQLGFSVYVQALREFITSQDTGTPLTIAIDGRWGTGKTSLMRMLQNELEPRTSLWRWLRFHESQFKPAELIWINWLIVYFITLPVWLTGKTLISIDNLFRRKSRRKFVGVRIGLSYNPSTNSINEFLTETNDEFFTEIDNGSLRVENVRFWANISASHCFLTSITHPTIWFNAWKFDEEEQLWSALALSVMGQIKSKYGFFQRIFFWLRLNFKRSTPLLAFWSLLEKVGIPIILGIFAWKYDYYLKQMASQKAVLPEFVSVGQPLLWIGAVLSGLSQVRSILKDPFQIRTERVLNNPNYREKVGFISRFENDFANIVSIATQPFWGWKSRKLVIFIDDLDRCEPPKSVNIIEAINLFLDSKDCVFIIGMDSTAVIASIETRYCDVFEKIKQENSGLVSPGRIFLDKIIQIPFQVPPVTSDKVDRLINFLIQKERKSNFGLDFRPEHSQNLIGNSGSTFSFDAKDGDTVTNLGQKLDIASYARKDVQDAIYLCSTLFKGNPRQIKRFINLFRLQIYIASKRGILEHYLNNQNKQVGITLEYLAIWVGFSLKYSDLIRRFFDVGQFFDLRDYISQLSSSIEDSGKLVSVDDLIEDIMQLQEENKEFKFHWCHLPWQSWLLDPDFLWGIKKLECFWYDSSGKQFDWLTNILAMTKVTLGKNSES
jgi:hypothetical protein